MADGYRIETGAIVRAPAGKRRRWRAYLTAAPIGDRADQHEGEGEGDTPAEALKGAADNLANQGALAGDRDEEGR